MTIGVKPTGGWPKPLQDQTNTIVDKTKAAITRVVLLLTRSSKDKLTDKVLNVRTGRLRRSVTSEVVEEAGQIVGRVGTNVSYAAAHEFGLNMDQKVQAHMRKMTQAFGKMLKEPIQVQVREHTRRMVLPERSFLRSALQEMQNDIPKELKSSIERT